MHLFSPQTNPVRQVLSSFPVLCENGGTEKVTCLRSHSQKVAELRFEPRQPGSRLHVIKHYLYASKFSGGNVLGEFPGRKWHEMNILFFLEISSCQGGWKALGQWGRRAASRSLSTVLFKSCGAGAPHVSCSVDKSGKSPAAPGLLSSLSGTTIYQL